jgi:hypothetical protein
MLSRVVAELGHKMTGKEKKYWEERVVQQKDLRPLEKWEVELFTEQLRRNGVLEGQLAASEFCCIHCNEETPWKYLLSGARK